MDIKYAYYNTSKGYRVVGGTAAHFLKADGSLDNKEYIDKYSIQTIDSTKTIGFQNTIYSGWDRSSVTNPQMGPFSLLNLALQGAYPLYGDEEFRYGNNGIGVYNNYGNGTVTMTREAASNLPNRSGMQLRFNYNGGGATPGLGGFLLGFNARANAIFIQKFMAKLPVGYSFNNAENYMGANASVNWLTPRAGTGKWETYVRAVICGTGTSFSSGGHVYVLGADTAVEFYLAFAEVYEVNSSVFSKIREAFYAKNETIHFNGATADLITFGDSYNQKKLLSTSWDGTNGDQILLRVPGSQNNGAYLRYSQNGTLNGNIGLVSSDNLTGGQIFNPQGDTLYLGNPSLPNLLLQTSTNTHFNYAGVGSIYTFNVNGVYLDRNINFNLDNFGVNFYDGGKIYKKAGSGVHINRGNNGLDPRIENADGSQSWMIFHEGNHKPFKNLRSGLVLEDVSESGIYRQESPTSGYNYTTTLNLNSSDGRQQLTIERGGKGMKFRGNTKSTGNSGWSGWNEVYHTGNFNSAIYVTQSALNTQLGNYATLNGVQTFTNTNTFNQSPIIPQGTLDSHAVNLAQLTNGNVATAGSLRNVNISLAQLNSMDLQPGMYNAEGYSIGQGLTATYHYIIQLGSYTGGGYRAQIAIPYSSGVNDSIYIRTSVGSTWGNFERIAKNTDITTALSNYALANGSNATDTWANAAKMLVTNPYIPGRTMNGSGTAYLNEATYGDVHGFLNSSGTAQGNPKDNWFHRIKMLHSNSSGYFTEIGVQMTGGNSMWYKRYENGTNYGWVQVWDKENLSQANINNWNIAYGWGNHANAGYATGTWVNTNFIPKSHPVYNITQANINSWNAAASGSSHTHSNLSYLNNIDQWLGVGQAPRFNSVFLMDAFGYGQLVFGEGNIGGESGLVDISNKRFYAGRINEYLKYGSSIDGFEGLNIHFDAQLLGIGRELGNHEDKVQLAGDLSVDTIDINHNSRQLILNPLYNTDGDVRHSRNAHIYIVTRNAVSLPDKPILGQRIEIFNDSDSGIEVTHSNVGTMFKVPGFCKVTGIAANKGFRFDAEPVYTKQYDI